MEYMSDHARQPGVRLHLALGLAQLHQGHSIVKYLLSP